MFAKVVSGTDVIDLIGKVTTGSTGGHQDVPTEAIMIEEVLSD